MAERRGGGGKLEKYIDGGGSGVLDSFKKGHRFLIQIPHLLITNLSSIFIPLSLPPSLPPSPRKKISKRISTGFPPKGLGNATSIQRRASWSTRR